jgi:hypothetical protein
MPSATRLTRVGARGSTSREDGMPRKRTACQRLDELRQQVAGEGVKLRAEQASLEAAKAEVEERSDR